MTINKKELERRAKIKFDTFNLERRVIIIIFIICELFSAMIIVLAELLGIKTIEGRQIIYTIGCTCIIF